MNRKVLAFIPARGGSKGVPNKNKRIVNKKPLILYTIEAAKNSNLISKIIVSSDDDEIIDIANCAGVHAIKRPEDLSGDESKVIDALRHSLSSIEEQFDAIVLLQPTSPLRNEFHIDEAINIFFSNENPVCSVYKCDDNHPARMYTIENGKLISLMPELASVRRQDLPNVYHRNGCIYVFGKAEVQSGHIINNDMTPYIMSTDDSLNIDNIYDLMLFEVIMSKK